MKTDYKFWYIRKNDNGFITDCAIRFYEGDYQTIDGKQVYIRTKRLETFNDLKHIAKKGKIRGITEQTGKNAVFYDTSDFGQIKTDEELRTFLNKELAKDKGREPINEQKI